MPPAGAEPTGWLASVTPAEEQAWNERRTSETVRVRQAAFWSYRAPAVVLGCAQRPDEATQAAARAAGLDLVQRRSGGGAVLAGAALLGLSVVLPPGDPLVTGAVTRNYRWLGLAHAEALGRLGIDARALDVAAARAAAAPAAGADLRWVCFGTLSPWEVVTAGGRKLVGLAQVRRREGTLLMAGTLLRDPDWGTLCGLFRRPPAEAVLLAQRTTSCERELGRPLPAADLARELRRSIGAVLGDLDAAGRLSVP